MRETTHDNRNMIHSKAIIDDNYVIKSADEEFYSFIGPNIRLITDAIHQVDIDDFINVVEHLNVFAPKNMVLRIRRADNTYRWCLMSLSKEVNSVNNNEHINIEISDIINLNNHYLALTRVFEVKKNEIRYSELMHSEELFEKVRSMMESETPPQIDLILLSIDDKSIIKNKYGEDFLKKMLDEIATELCDFVGERGFVSEFSDERYIIMLRNVGNEGNLRAFLESTRAKLKWKYVNRTDSINLSFTFAISETPRNGKDFELIKKKLLKAYDIAVSRGNGHYIIYKEELHGEL